jgi:hypothetical protein
MAVLASASALSEQFTDALLPFRISTSVSFVVNCRRDPAASPTNPAAAQIRTRTGTQIRGFMEKVGSKLGGILQNERSFLKNNRIAISSCDPN